MTYSPIRPAAVDGSTGFRRSCSTSCSAAALEVFGFRATAGGDRQRTIARLSLLVLPLSLFFATPDLPQGGPRANAITQHDSHRNDAPSSVPGSEGAQKGGRSPTVSS